MEINDIFIKVVLILIPGLICSSILKQLSYTSCRTPFSYCVNSIILGIFVFFVLEVSLLAFNLFVSIINGSFSIGKFPNLNVWQYLYNSKTEIDITELFWSYILAIPIGIFFSLIITRNYFFRFLQKLNLTEKIGNEDVWFDFLSKKEIEWAWIKDFDNDLAYYGCINNYSVPNSKREIMLNNVLVYKLSTFDQLNELESIYIELGNSRFTIEIQKK